MKKLFFSLLLAGIFLSCNNSSSTSTTADSLNRASSADTMTNHQDTTSYERSSATGVDTTKH